MSAKIDLAGKRFGRLYVIEDTGKRRNTGVIYLCECDCGNIVEIAGRELRQGDTKSCGCLRVDKMSTHRSSYTRLYKIWTHMLSRCNRKTDTTYKNYGAKGVSVCFEWKDFPKFKEWSLKNGYRDDLSIDRIDPTGNYEPSNCRWATQEIQSNNKRNSIWVDVNGERLTLAQLSRKYNFHYDMIQHRYSKGLRGEELITETCSRSKSKNYDIEEVKWLLNNTSMLQREIGEIYKIAGNSISKIKMCATYVDVKERKPEWWDNGDERFKVSHKACNN